MSTQLDSASIPSRSLKKIFVAQAALIDLKLPRYTLIILRKRCLGIGMHPKDGTSGIIASLVCIVECDLCFSELVSPTS